MKRITKPEEFREGEWYFVKNNTNGNTFIGQCFHLHYNSGEPASPYIDLGDYKIWIEQLIMTMYSFIGEISFPPDSMFDEDVEEIVVDVDCNDGC